MRPPSLGSILGQFIFLQFIAIVLSIGPVHEDIIQWWNELSVQKPLKCNLNPLYKQPLYTTSTLSNMMKPQKNSPILYSRPCHYDDRLEQFFVYKGDRKITFVHLFLKHFKISPFIGQYENGYFEGPAKLKINIRLPIKHSPGKLKSENKVRNKEISQISLLQSTAPK